MGNSAAKPSGSAATVENDPCQPQMDSYLTCVRKHERGLSENDDCQDEVALYKQCRKVQKELSKKSTSS